MLWKLIKNENISSAAGLPTNFQVFRNDHSDSYGGVLIAVREDLICSPVLTSQKTELIRDFVFDALEVDYYCHQ
jgi:hypothetical protein